VIVRELEKAEIGKVSLKIHITYIVVNNGYFFNNNKDLKQFILYIGENEQHNTNIDLNVYGKNQNFKLPYQSKLGSLRVQNPLNGTFRDHMIGRHKDDYHFKGHLAVSYNTETLPKKGKNNIIKNLNEKKYKNTSTELYDIGPINEMKDLVVDITDVKSLMNVLGSEIGFPAWNCCMCIFKNEGYELNDSIE